MYDGYLALDGIEILNRARSAAYLREFLAGKVDVLCDDAGLQKALGHTPYLMPNRDGAPWYTGGQKTIGARFLGLYPGKITGAENSTRKMQITELSGDGAVLTSPRYGSHEMRFVATAFALDEEAMEEGYAWLKEALSNDGCFDGNGIGCTGRVAKLFAAQPSTTLEAYSRARTFHRVEVTEGPLVVAKYPVKGFVMWQIEFTVTAGIPWSFTSLADIATLNMDYALNFQDPVGEDCSVTADAYDTFVDDPFFTGINRPPRAPVILPPNIIDITSWRRQLVNIPTSHTDRWGRVVPVVQVSTEAAVQFLRLRFYESGKTGCDFEGEFLISYMPPRSVLKLDSIKREATLQLSDGKTVPAGHLLFGSEGRPFLWPTLGCRTEYQMAADLMPGQAGVVIMLQTAVRS